MTGNIVELKKKIIQKNQILDALACSNVVEEEKITNVKVELDRLLYQYYKLLKFN